MRWRTYLTETPGILSVLKYLVDDCNKIFFFLVSEEFFGPAGGPGDHGVHVARLWIRSHNGHVRLCARLQPTAARFN